MRKLAGTILMTTTLAVAGCLEKDTTHTILIDPAGPATWVALEQDVYSDEADPLRRHAEELTYITSAAANAHDVARGLAALDPQRQQTRIIRGDRPFTVVTDAQFDSLEFLVRRLLTHLRVEGTVAITTSGPVTTLTVRIDTNSFGPGSHAGESPIEGLFEDLDRYAFVLTDGRFISATGFTLDRNCRRAKPIEASRESIAANGGILELSLTWRNEEL